MPNVIAVVQDDRLRRQIEQFLGEMGMDDLRLATFESDQEFQQLYFRDHSKDPPPPEITPGEENPDGEPTGESGAELKLFSEIHLMIVALDTIEGKSGAWIDKLKVSLKKWKYWPVGGHVRLILMKYEDDGISKLDVLHPLLDDLIYLPIDRLVFLQKMQIFITLPKKVTPTFLFNQEVQQEIEISKISKVDRLSDVGLAIRNPVPLRRGLPGHFYVQLPGEKTRLEMRGKVIRSVPHPEFPGQHLVYFSYFGMSKAALTQIRRVLSKAPRYQSLLNDNTDDFRRKSSIFDEDGGAKPFGIAIVDPDDLAGHNLATQLDKEMSQLDVLTESSYQLFLHKYLDDKPDRSTELETRAVEPTEFFHNPISLTVSTSELKCLSVDPGPKPEDKFLGFEAEQLFATPEGWLSLIQEKESALIMQEAALLSAKGRVVQKLLIAKDSEGGRRALNFKFFKGEAEEAVMIEIRPSTLADIAARRNEEKNSFKLHCAIIDASFVPDEATSWVEGLKMRAVQVGLAENTDQLKFFFTSDHDIKPSMSWLNVKEILGLFIKPLDTRQMLFLLSEFLPNPMTMYQFDNLGWSQPSMSVHVAKNVHLEALSEYGATIKSVQNLIPGTMIYLRQSIFDNAPNQCLAARVYASQEHPKDKGFYQVHTTYFGINDSFLKFARTWIRENYAHTKKGDA